MTNSANPDQLASEDAVCKGRTYPGSAGLGLIDYINKPDKACVDV